MCELKTKNWVSFVELDAVKRLKRLSESLDGENDSVKLYEILHKYKNGSGSDPDLYDAWHIALAIRQSMEHINCEVKETYTALYDYLKDICGNWIDGGNDGKDGDK